MNLSVNRPSEPEKLHCLYITQRNEAIEVTKLQPLSQDSMEQQTVSREACKLSLKAALSQEFHSYIKNANHSIENLTDNAELETCDGQLLLTTSTSLENLVNSDLSNLQYMTLLWLWIAELTSCLDLNKIKIERLVAVKQN